VDQFTASGDEGHLGFVGSATVVARLIAHLGTLLVTEYGDDGVIKVQPNFPGAVQVSLKVKKRFIHLAYLFHLLRG